MNNIDDISKAIALLNQTLPEMNKRNIPTTPANYAIWYEYVSGDNKKLADAIHALDQQHATFSESILQELHAEYISNAHQAAVNKLSKSVKEIINDFLSKVNAEGNGLTHYAKTLAEFSSKVEDVNDISDIKNLITHLLDETKKREDATLNMQTSLETMSLEMKKLRTEVSKLNSEATTDTLTRINNRRAFEMEIDQQVSTCKSEAAPMCLLFIDIDHFKAFNSKFGHTIGDKVLRFVATLFKNNIKGSDSVARFGGKKFVILLPETKYDDALAVAENIRERLSKQTLSDSAKKIELGTISASIGVASYVPNETSEDLIARAERCVHEAKHSGRNRVVGDKSLNQTEKKLKQTLI